MRIEAMREFIEFARHQNISKAAEKLFMSQPAMSNHIASLEKKLGVELVRRGKTLELTAAGKAFFEGCCEVVGSYDVMLDTVRLLAEQEEQGTLILKMAFNDSGGSSRLMELVGEFRAMNPGATVKIYDSSKGSVIDELDAGLIDCAQIYNFVPPSREATSPLRGIVIDRAPVSLVARKGHPLMGKKSVTFDDIVDYPYAMPAGTAFEECELSIRQLYRRHGRELKNIHFKVVDSLIDLISFETKGDEVLILGASPSLPGNMTSTRFEPEVYQDFCLAFREDNDNPLLKSFIAFVEASLPSREPSGAQYEVPNIGVSA